MGGGQGGRVLSFGRSRAKLQNKETPTNTFADVAGADEAVAELREIKDFLASPDKYKAIGAKIPKGVLLYGPPGTGKTLLARAVAGEAKVPFYSISGSEFVEMFAGLSATGGIFEGVRCFEPVHAARLRTFLTFLNTFSISSLFNVSFSRN